MNLVLGGKLACTVALFAKQGLDKHSERQALLMISTALTPEN